MEQGSLSVTIAFFAGVVAFFSPCLLPLLPVYLGFMAGSATDEGGRPVRNRVLLNSLNFIVGFSAVFILLGILASWFATFFVAHQVTLQRIAGALIVLFGLHLAGVLSPAFMQREQRMRYMPANVGPGTSMLMGVAFAAGWTPCIGPVLGAILVYAAATGSGVPLLVAFSVGIALPFFLAALLVEHTGRLVERFVAYLPKMQKIFGFVLVAFGLAVFFGVIARLAMIFY